MASYTVHPPSVEHARSLIDARRYVVESERGDVHPGAGDENAFLERHGWADDGAWHLAVTDGANEETEARQAFADGDVGRVHRMGLTACRSRAARWRHEEVGLAVHDLLRYLDRAIG